MCASGSEEGVKGRAPVLLAILYTNGETGAGVANP